jgi:hypothetical protein
MYYADVLGFMRTTNASGYLAWTLFDFSHVPHTVAGRFPWQTEPQKHLGVLGQNGTPKRAALLLAPNASLDVPRIPGWARFFKPFWLTVLTVVVISTAIIGRRFLLFERRLKRTITHPLPDPSATRITQPLPELRAAPITQPLPDLPQALDRRNVLGRLVRPQLTMIRTRFQQYGGGQRRWVWVGMICLLAVLSVSIARYISTTVNERLVNSGEPPFAPASNTAIASATLPPRDPIVALASPTTTHTASPTIVATATGVPTSTPTPVPTTMAATPTPVPATPATPAPTDALMRFVDETFTSPASGWPTRTTATSSIQYADGRYQLTLNGQTDVGVSTAFSSINYRLSVDVVVMQGRAGLVFLSAEPATFYRLVIDTEGRYAIERHQQDTGITMNVVDWTEQGALQRGAGVLNRLRAERQGSTITFFANDQPLTTFPIPQEAVTNRYGFVLTSQAQQGQALFDNLVGERLPNS